MSDIRPLSKPSPSAMETTERVFPPAERRHLQQRYDQAARMMADPEYDPSQAHALLAECAVADPGNPVYVDMLLRNLTRMPTTQRAVKRLWPGGPQKALARAAGDQDWSRVFQLGPEAMLADPQDAATFGLLAQASDACGYSQTAMLYLNHALSTDPDNISLNRQAARTLARVGRFEQAIIHWQKVERADPRDDEAPRMISVLTLEKSRQPIGEDSLEDAAAEQTTADADEAKSWIEGAADGSLQRPKALVLTPRQTLERAIVENPEDETNYLKLAELHLAEDRVYDAQRTLTKALNVTADLRIVEKLEDVNILRAAQQVEIARQRAAEERTTEALDLVDKLEDELQRLEFEVLRARCERYPEDKSLRFQLGLRLKRLGSFRQALEPLQAGLELAEYRAVASLEIGEILQRYKQFPRALQCYRQAVQLASNDPPDEECRRRALYRAGVLATAMGVMDSAKHYLAELVKTAPDYKDAKSRLDKLNEIDETF
ncbi:MAG: hypothetical protein JJ992_03935 [Planctomycetes bacterium]|nr:hypothetical protein [Planctomycetota bacterium]